MTEGLAPRRAKLELLVRRDDDSGHFEIRQVGSALAFVQSRPQRVGSELFELAEVRSRVGQHNFILKNTQTERFLLLSAQERFLWDRMDGRTSLQEMATGYVLEYGEFDFEIIPNLIRKLQRAQLLTMRPTSRVRRVLARNRGRRVVKTIETTLTALERITISSRRVHPLFRGLYRWGGFLLFTPVAVIGCMLLSIVGLVAGFHLLPNAEDVTAGFGAHPVLAVVSVKLFFMLTVAAHQVVHGLALIHYKRVVREFGFTFLHGFVPTFYVDITDIFMAKRRGRVVTAVSGAAVHLVVGAIWFLVAARTTQGFMQAFAAASGVIQVQAFVLALYPFCFIEMDGYHVLVDALGVPTLKQDAMAYVGRLLRGATPLRLSRETGMWLGYVALSTVSVAAFVAFNVWLVIQATS